MNFQKIKHALWGDLTHEEFKKFSILSSTLLFIIGTYWLMRPLKDSLFLKIVGSRYLPYAKIGTFLLIGPLVLIYSKLVDLIEKQKLFYCICIFYGTIFLIITFLLTHPTIGLAQTTPSPRRLIGWVIYLAIESFGSLIIALFWSFVASNDTTDSAKRGYPLIISGAQLGSIAGPSIALHANTLGMPTLMFIVVCGIMAIPLLIKLFIMIYPSNAETATALEKQPHTGALEGLRLLVTHPYLLGIFVVSTFYDIIGTLIEYQMQTLADQKFHSAEKIAEFIGLHGIATNSVTLMFAFFGASFFIRRFGLTFCLLMFPITVTCTILAIWAAPLLWTFFFAMVILKALSYALNNPCKEIMYIPTSKDIKFKAKSWIDMIGNRSAKATGAGISACFTDLSQLLAYGSLFSLGIVGIWILGALYVSKTHKKLIAQNKSIS